MLPDSPYGKLTQDKAAVLHFDPRCERTGLKHLILHKDEGKKEATNNANETEEVDKDQAALSAENTVQVLNDGITELNDRLKESSNLIDLSGSENNCADNTTNADLIRKSSDVVKPDSNVPDVPCTCPWNVALKDVVNPDITENALNEMKSEDIKVHFNNGPVLTDGVKNVELKQTGNVVKTEEDKKDKQKKKIVLLWKKVLQKKKKEKEEADKKPKKKKSVMKRIKNAFQKIFGVKKSNHKDQEKEDESDGTESEDDSTTDDSTSSDSDSDSTSSDSDSDSTTDSSTDSDGSEYSTDYDSDSDYSTDDSDYTTDYSTDSDYTTDDSTNSIREWELKRYDVDVL